MANVREFELPTNGVNDEEVVLILSHGHHVINIGLNSLLKTKEGNKKNSWERILQSKRKWLELNAVEQHGNGVHLADRERDGQSPGDPMKE
jgi:hypothetical protein